MPAIHLLIKGEVQGCFLQGNRKKVADKLGLTGWVKNTAEGNVETIVSGPREQLDEFINWCKTGPEKAVVTDVIVTPEKETSFAEFEVIRGR